MNKMNLKLNETITVLKPMELIPLRITGKLIGYYFDKFAQYENSLYLFIQRSRAKRVDRIIITENDTVFIFKGKFQDSWRKEKVSEVTTNLNRITYEDIKENKNLIYSHLYGEKFNINDNTEYFIEKTGDYMMYNDIRHFEAEENENYINYIKELAQNFNIGKIKDLCKIEGYSVLLNCINKAVGYN